jgi:hypothetical protein
MTIAQRRACLTALLVGATAGTALIAVVFSKTAVLTAPHYRLTVSVVAQARGRQPALKAAAQPLLFVSAVLRRHDLSVRRSADTRMVAASNGKLDGTYVHEEALATVSTRSKILERVSAEIERSSRWEVIDLFKGGEFVPGTTGRGVHLWRLRSGLAGGNARHSWIQIDGPTPMLTYSDYFMFAFIVMLVISFGSVERSRHDGSAFPAGMHPVIVTSQTLLIALLVCWLWICYRVGYMSPASIGIALLGAASLAWWGFKTRGSWIELTHGDVAGVGLQLHR